MTRGGGVHSSSCTLASRVAPPLAFSAECSGRFSSDKKTPPNKLRAQTGAKLVGRHPGKGIEDNDAGDGGKLSNDSSCVSLIFFSCFDYPPPKMLATRRERP